MLVHKKKNNARKDAAGRIILRAKLLPSLAIALVTSPLSASHFITLVDHVKGGCACGPFVFPPYWWNLIHIFKWEHLSVKIHPLETHGLQRIFLTSHTHGNTKAHSRTLIGPVKAANFPPSSKLLVLISCSWELPKLTPNPKNGEPLCVRDFSL